MEIVCNKCGTLNKEKSILCLRCGEVLETTTVKKYDYLKRKLVSEKLLLTLYSIIFTIYLFLIVFLLNPILNESLLRLGDSYIFEFYNNQLLTNIALGAIYTVIIFLLNYLIIVIILESITYKKSINFDKVKLFYLYIFIYSIISISLVTVLHRLNLILILEHIISLIAIFPYIKRKTTKIINP